MLSRGNGLCKLREKPLNLKELRLKELLKDSATRQLATEVKPPVHQAVYEALRDRLLFGELEPGQAVTIQGLCDSLSAGMTPVREAIRRLIAEGALQMRGNRRVVVPSLTVNGVKELDFMRKSLEGELTRRAVHRLSADTLRRMDDIDSALNNAIARGDIRAYLTLNYAFHTTLYSAADSPIVLATVTRLWLRFGPSLRVVVGRYGTMNLPDKHAELLQALAAKDAAAAQLAIKEDIDQGMSQIEQALATLPSETRFD